MAAANQTLRRYETAYATMRVDAVRSVYPSAPIDELEKDFAGATSCTVKVVIDGNWRLTAASIILGIGERDRSHHQDHREEVRCSHPVRAVS